MTVGVPVKDAPGEKVDVLEGVIDGVADCDGEFEGVGDCVTDGVGEFDGTVPRIIMLSAESAAVAEVPTVTAVTRQQTVGLLFAAAGIARDLIAGNHVPAGARVRVTPKFVKGPAVPTVL